MKVTINQQGMDALNMRLLTRVLIPAMEYGVEETRSHTHIDTSSLLESTRLIDPGFDMHGNPRVSIAQGGEDYRGQIMGMTGEEGNLVDYALDQEMQHGALEGGAFMAGQRIIYG